jgi:hypothetical protein
LDEISSTQDDSDDGEYADYRPDILGTQKSTATMKNHGKYIEDDDDDDNDDDNGDDAWDHRRTYGKSDTKSLNDVSSLISISN